MAGRQLDAGGVSVDSNLSSDSSKTSTYQVSDIDQVESQAEVVCRGEND